MSTTHVSRHNHTNPKSTVPKPKNGYTLPKNNTYSPQYSNQQYLSTHHKNGYTTPQKTAYHTYNKSFDSDPDSDTLNDMESQSPHSSPPNHPRTNTNTLLHSSNTINNHSVRHRLPKHSPNLTSHSNSPSLRNRYYRQYKYKKFQPQYKHKKNGYSPKQKQDYTFKIIAGIALFTIAISIYYFYGDLLTFTALKENHHSIIQFIDKYPVFSPLIFILFECIVVGLTIPGATVLSMAAGLFFRQPFASIYAWLGCGSGALICYLSVRYICADCFKSLLTKHGEWFKTFESGLKKNELLYLIYVRYVIIIPFWFVNVAAALFGCKAYNFILSTFIATIPGSLLLTTAGRGLANAFESYTDEITAFGLFKEVLWSKDMLLCVCILLFCLSIPFLLKTYGGKQFDIFNDSESDLRKSLDYSKWKDNDFIDSDSDDNYRHKNK